jgi:AbrB family looped-hinge helix DNA binding protein
MPPHHASIIRQAVLVGEVRHLAPAFETHEASSDDARDAPNYSLAIQVIHVMRSTITARGQTVVPAPIRERFGLGPSTRLEWIVDGDGSIRVVPVALDPIQAFRGSGAGGGTARLLADRASDRQKEAR